MTFAATRFAVVVLCCGLGSGCSGRGAPLRPPTATASPAASAAPETAATAAAPVEAAAPSHPEGEAMAPASPSAGADAERQPPKGAFPPDDFEPPFEKSAQPGDGRWVPLGDAAAGDRAAAPPTTMVKTTVHPHPVSRFEVVTVVAMDLTRLAVHFAPGTDDPRAEQLGADYPPGLVPDEHRDALLVVFNGGFKPRHGRWGMMLAGRELLAPKAEGCTIALLRNGAVRIASWPELEPEVASMAAYRQTPPCLLEQGSVHPGLLAKQERAWGGRSPKRKTRRRTALGIDETGTVLLFGMGIEVGPRRLAEGMKHAGAVAAAQLDINWSWTRFLLFGQPAGGDRLQVTSTLIPQMVHARFGYVERAAFRDFFYVTQRR